MSDEAAAPDEEFLAITADLLRVFGQSGRLLVKLHDRKAIGYLRWLKDAPIREPHA